MRTSGASAQSSRSCCDVYTCEINYSDCGLNEELPRAFRCVCIVLSRGMALHKTSLRRACGFAAGYQSVRRFVRKLQAGSSPEPRAIIETPPGEELQVDYGEGPMVCDPHTGKYKRTRLFVLTLGFSRKCVRLLVFRSSSQTWAELHEKAFRRLGGVTA